MGCDFQIVGSQPDEEKQENCVSFLKSLRGTGEEEEDSSYTVIDSSTTMPPGTRIQREKRLIFKLPEPFAGLSERYPGKAFWKPGTLYGIVLRAIGGYPVHIVFDREKGGTLCSVEMFTDEPYGGVKFAYKRNEEDYKPPPDMLRLWFGTCTRIGTGSASLYVISHAIKQ